MEASIYFTTSGHLYVQLIEVIDLLEAVNGAASFFTVFKKKVKERHLVHVEVKIINTKRKEIQKVRTGTKLINPGENLNVGEDFVFESISSAYTIVVSLHLTTIANGETTQKIMGLATIPIDRLEENTKVS